ncbi:MAG TPA: LysR family transcriptional regulator [Luteimicrobium sp.]|nr:LysR family transcriptional regulator [Luteimicrobium sp.]
METLEIRDLRHFVVVAEELHYGHAAARLRVAQPALSKTVQRLEARLGARLLDRTSRSVALTPAGTVLLEHGRHVLHAADLAVQETRRAAQQDGLRLVMKPGGDAGLLSGILAAYAEHPDATQVDVEFSGSTDRTARLRDGRADVALLYAPFDDLAGLVTETLHTEDRVAILPADHPLASRDRIRAAELAGETFPRWRGVPGDQPEGPELADVAELVSLVRIGRVVAVLPRSLVAPAPPGTACVPVEDAEPSRIVVARNEHDDRESVLALVAAAARAARR